jgi:hypothetical protein
MLVFLVNLVRYGAGDPSLPGAFLIFAGYLGETIGQSLWIFALPLLYRLFLRLTKKPYSRSFETTALLVGGLIALLGMSGSTGDTPEGGTD